MVKRQIQGKVGHGSKLLSLFTSFKLNKTQSDKQMWGIMEELYIQKNIKCPEWGVNMSLLIYPPIFYY